MLRRTLLATLAALLAFTPAVSAEVMEWRVDPNHSNVGFKIRHFMVSWIRGTFRQVEGLVWFDKDDLSTLKMDVTINPASVDTGVQRRDDHLRNPDFFEVGTYPEMRFVSTKAEKQHGGTVKVTGDLSMHGKTNSVTLSVEGLGRITNPGSGPRAGASARGVLKRSEWGMTFTEPMETGGITIGDEVYIEIEAELRPVE